MTFPWKFGLIACKLPSRISFEFKYAQSFSVPQYICQQGTKVNRITDNQSVNLTSCILFALQC